MSRWDDQFEQHPIFGSLSDARQQLDGVSGQITEADDRELHGRIVRVLEYLDRALRASDPELVQFAALDQLSGTLSQIVGHMQQFAANPRAALEQANSQADAVVTQGLSLSARVAPADVQDLQNAVSTFRRSAGQHLRNLEAEVGAAREQASRIESQLQAHETKIQAQDARLDAVVTEYQAQFSAAQAQRQTEFSQALAEDRAQLRVTVDEARQKIETTTGDARAELTSVVEDLKATGAEALAGAKERADRQNEETLSRSGAAIERLDGLLEKAVKTVGVIGSTGMAGGYQVVANSEMKAANIWRLVATAAFVGAIGAAIFALAHGLSEGFELDRFFAKAAIAIPFAALAGYAISESSRHREHERTNRQVELQLASLDAYLVTLPQPEQDRIRAQLAERFFGELRDGSGAPELPP